MRNYSSRLMKLARVCHPYPIGKLRETCRAEPHVAVKGGYSDGLQLSEVLDLVTRISMKLQLAGEGCRRKSAPLRAAVERWRHCSLASAVLLARNLSR